MKMKIKCLLALQMAACCCAAQQHQKDVYRQQFGLKAGITLNYLKGNGYFNPGNKTGFMAGTYFAMPSKGLGYRTELVFSRQGYSYENNTKTGSVQLDYILLPQLATFNIGNVLQVHAGAQLGFLLKSRIDSTPSSSSVPAPAPKDFFNKINYGLAAGAEVRPIAGLVIGSRYNLFFKTLGDPPSSPTVLPPYVPPANTNLRNGLVQVYIGYLF